MPEITRKDALAWLDKQRDAVNEKVVAASPQEEGQYKKELQIINAITERVKALTAVEYLEAFHVMCDGAGDTCDKCPMDFSFSQTTCRQLEERNPRAAMEIVKKWKEEHYD